MKDVDQQRGMGWALPASVTVHALAAALLIFGLPVSLFEAEPEKAINVDLVPPPEPPKKAETAKAEPPPKKPEPPPEAKAEKPPEPKPEAEKEAAQRAAENVLQPVHRFGEKDGGPKIALDGDSAEEASPEAKPASEQPDAAKPEAEQAEAQKPELEKTDAAQPRELTAARGAEQTPLPTEGGTAKPVVEEKKTEQKKPATPADTKKLASRMATGNAVATTAMGGVPRGVRAGRLCVTELRERMRNASPPYFPDLLPSYPLESGNVLDIPRAAFRLGGAWYELAFRCEVDSNATQVLVFVFRVGGPIPPGDWKRRGLPAR
jgi:hypothetical protein